MIGLWCNGSTTGFGSVCPGSNPGNPTRKSPANIVCGAFSLLVSSLMKGVPEILRYALDDKLL